MADRNAHILEGGELYAARDARTGRYRPYKILAAAPHAVAIVQTYKEDFATAPTAIDTRALTRDACGPVRYAAIFAHWLASADYGVEEVTEAEARSVDIIVKGVATPSA